MANTNDTESEQDCCGRCEEPHENLQETGDGEKICPPCIKREAAHAREGERGQGQRPIGEQRAIDRHELYGSGWPR